MFPFFTVICALAFVLNLAVRFAGAYRPDSVLTNAIAAVLDLATGLLPPLLFYLIYAEEKPGLASAGFGTDCWRRSMPSAWRRLPHKR